MLYLIIQSIGGTVGGSVAGSIMMDSSLGTVGNSLAGILVGIDGGVLTLGHSGEYTRKEL